MATLKLKKTGARSAEPRPERAPLRGAGSAPRKRPTLSEAQALRAEREARYQEQLRQRFGDKPPAQFVRRDEPAPRPRRPDPAPPPQRPRPQPNRAFESRHAPPRHHHDDRDDHDDAPRHAEIPGSMRLSKRMSELGMASRREADEWIAKGWVRVDDQVVSELGSRVVPGQRITVDAKAKYQQAQKVTVLLNKPIGFVSGQAEDGYEPAVVLVTPQNQWRNDNSGIRFLREHLRGLAPAGRLDIDSVGLQVIGLKRVRIGAVMLGDLPPGQWRYLRADETFAPR